MGKLLSAAIALVAFLAMSGSGAAQLDLTSTEATRYVVVFNQANGLPANAARVVADAGGTIVSRAGEIGAVLAESNNPSFATRAAAVSSVRAVAEDEMASIPDPAVLTMDVGAEGHTDGGQASPTGPDPQPGSEPLYNQQWDKMRMNASATGSYAIQQGRRDVVVAVLDTGADVLPSPHPDIAPNLDAARSRSFVTSTGEALPEGDPNPASWDDKHGHGSWTLSAVGAPINQFGISGVAPRVTLVALKVLGDTGGGSYFAVANALVYAGNNKFDAASMSLGGFLRHAGGGNAVWIVVQRAVEYARSNGVLPIASAGNSNLDGDGSSGSVYRDIVVSPAGHAGVVTVAATGYYNQKAFYSNYGHGYIDVSAPGGSTRDNTGVPGSGVPTASPYRGQGRVLGAWSAENTGGVLPPQVEEQCDPATGNCYKYAWVQGTSMAAPNAAGVAALIISQYGDFGTQNPQMSHMPPQQVEQILAQTANNQPCPESGTFSGGPGFPQAECTQAAGYNNYFGKGIVDAVKAVTTHGTR